MCAALSTNDSSSANIDGKAANDLPEQEAARLGALRDLSLLDTPESESFDRITRMACRLFDTPVGAVSLTDHDRQWFKSSIGTGGKQLPRAQAPCAEVTRTSSMLVIPDLLLDPRFADSPLAKSGIRFYAGAPLVTRDGHALGAMCVLDAVPRTMTAADDGALQDFAAMVMAQIELQRDVGRIDPLSHLPNRHQLSDDLDDLARDHHGQARVAMLVELVDPKQIHDIVGLLGAPWIDALIRASSRAVKDVVGRGAALYHVGTTDFMLVIDEALDGSWRTIMDRVSALLTGSVSCDGVPIAVEPIFGVSPFEAGVTGSSSNVFRTAVSAAGDARAAGLSYAVYSPASDEAHRRRFGLLADFRQALTQPGELRLVFQPRLDAQTGKTLSAEALLRWHHPRLGVISPMEFIPLVEQTALVRPMTEWVMQAALNEAASWRQAGMDVGVSINLAARNLEESDFASRMAAALRQTGVPAFAVELEFTESALIREPGKVLGQINALVHIGVEIAIDDFGTGYSNFVYLRQIPATTVKLDKSFVGMLGSSKADRQLVKAMIDMAHGLDMRAVAEGVETKEVMDYLVHCGCDEIQGYLIAPPLSADAFSTWLRESANVGSAREMERFLPERHAAGVDRVS